MRPLLLLLLGKLLGESIIVLHDAFVVADLAEFLAEFDILLNLDLIAPSLYDDFLSHLLILVIRVLKLGRLALPVAGSRKFFEGHAVDRESESVVLVVNVDRVLDVPIGPGVHPLNWERVTIIQFHLFIAGSGLLDSLLVVVGEHFKLVC